MIDILLQHPAEPQQIQLALATFYQLREGFGLASWRERKTYHTIPLSGDVALLLSVYQDAKDEPGLAAFLARYFQCKVIISDDAIGPYTWLLIDETGKKQPIDQDPEVEQEDWFMVAPRHKHLL